MSLSLYNFMQSDYFSNPDTKVDPQNPEYLFNKAAAQALQMALFTNDLYTKTFATPLALEILNRMTQIDMQMKQQESFDSINIKYALYSGKVDNILTHLFVLGLLNRECYIQEYA